MKDIYVVAIKIPLINSYFMTTSGHFSASYIDKTEVQTVILRCLVCLNLNWIKSYDIILVKKSFFSCLKMHHFRVILPKWVLTPLRWSFHETHNQVKCRLKNKIISLMKFLNLLLSLFWCNSLYSKTLTKRTFAKTNFIAFFFCTEIAKISPSNCRT